MDFLLAYATSLAAFMPYILPGIKVILRNRNYDIEHLGGFIDEPQSFVKQKILFFDIFNQFLKSRNSLLCLNNNMTGSHREHADFPSSSGRKREEKNVIRC